MTDTAAILRAASFAAHKLAAQRRDMMTKWADYRDRLRDGAQVIPMPGRAA